METAPKTAPSLFFFFLCKIVIVLIISAYLFLLCTKVKVNA